MAAVGDSEQPFVQAPGESVLVKDAMQEVRMGFVRKVLSIVAAQLTLTAVIAVPVSQHVKTMPPASVSHLMIFSFAMTLVTMCAMVCCKDLAKTTPKNYICLFVFTLFEGVCMGVFCAQFKAEVVMLGLVITAFVVAGLMIFAAVTKNDFTGMGPYLMGALLAMMGVSFGMSMCCALFGLCFSGMVMIYNMVGVLVFSLYIVYDTQLIIGGNHEQEFSVDDYVFAALNLYLDILNLFMYIVQLLNSDR